MADTVLIVEDDTDTREMLTHIVQGEGFEVIPAEDGKQALRVIEKGRADVVILDRLLPDMDGIHVCQQARKLSHVPIIVLSALTTETDKVAGLNVGADDYIEKPFQPGELTARIRAQLRRARFGHSMDEERVPVRVGNLAMDPTSFTVTVGEDAVHLTRLEFELLYTLARADGNTVPRERLLETVWGEDRAIDPDGLNVYIRRLRRKIEKNPERPERLLTVRTIGYKLVAPRTSERAARI